MGPVVDKNLGHLKIVSLSCYEKRRATLFIQLVQVDLFLPADVLSDRLVANAGIAGNHVQSCPTSVVNSV